MIHILYCHDNDNDKYTKHAEYKTEVIAGGDNQKKPRASHLHPFADLKSMLKK